MQFFGIFPDSVLVDNDSSAPWAEELKQKLFSSAVGKQALPLWVAMQDCLVDIKIRLLSMLRGSAGRWQRKDRAVKKIIPFCALRLMGSVTHGHMPTRSHQWPMTDPEHLSYTVRMSVLSDVWLCKSTEGVVQALVKFYLYL